MKILRNALRAAILPAVLLFTFYNPAQAQKYEVTVGRTTYFPIQDPIALTGNGWDSQGSASILIGYNISYFGKNISSLQLNNSGLISLTESGTAGFYAAKAPFAYRPNAKIYRANSGSGGNYITKFEWSGAGFESDGTDQEYMNFQIWIYQKTGEIEFRYGESNVKPENFSKYFGGKGLQVAITNADKSLTFYLSGHPDSPSVVKTPAFLDSIPEDGTVYTFKYNPNASVEFSGAESPTLFSIYPNPANGELNIKWNAYRTPSATVLTLSDLQGRTVYSENLSLQDMAAGNKKLDLGGLPKGMYLMQVTSSDVVTTRRLIIE